MKMDGPPMCTNNNPGSINNSDPPSKDLNDNINLNLLGQNVSRRRPPPAEKSSFDSPGKAWRQTLGLYFRIYAPLGVSILFPVTCITPYLCALYNGKVEPFFPLVSDVGALVPQAAYFSQLLYVIALLVFVTGAYRKQIIATYIESLEKSNAEKQQAKNEEIIRFLRHRNSITFRIIIVVAAGIVLIGNFRSTENLPGHLVGVVMLFSGFPTYAIIHIKICNRLSKVQLESRPVTMFIIGLIGLIGLVCCAVLEAVSAMPPTSFEQMVQANSRLMWNKYQPHYWAHSFASVAEWTAINGMGLMYLCFFNRARIYYRKVYSKVPDGVEQV